MLTSITLQNFRSFGEAQTIPLQPITVLVGPNNSGKSNLVSVARLFRKVAAADPWHGQVAPAFDEEGGLEFIFHRPAAEDATLRIGWSVEETGSYALELFRYAQRGYRTSERIEATASGKVLSQDSRPGPFFGLWDLLNRQHNPDWQHLRPVCSPMARARELKLTVPALRSDAPVVPDPVLGADGSGMAAMLGFWRGAKLDRAEELDAFIRSCLPEIARVLVKPGPKPGEQRLWVRQTDGEEFDAAHVSDGVLSFIALAMHAIDAEPGALLFVEEPEQSIHPRRLHDLMELFRTIVHKRKCQIVAVTHSPVLLHELRDEPEAILLFRRGERGSRVDPLTKFPDLMEALESRKADPGDMLIDGFLNEPS